ncbi:MAG TPA: AAA family ATPase, partial [Gammaproteobacteria bacterium]|nr:AAA family ATPase [Gammaproteobacteria bacterium]
MYEAHFGMRVRPFDGGIAQDLNVFRGGAQDAIIGKFKQALAAPDSVVVLTGSAGVGKTTLTSTALRATSTRLALAWLNAVPTNATELLELLLVELGVNAHRATRIERLQMWRQTLSELSATESRVFVIAERTEDLAPEVLRALDSLTAADANGFAGANVVLLGGPGLDPLLAQPAYDSLRQRIRLRQKIAPLAAAELDDYLRHRVASAGGDFDRVFAPGTTAAVQRYTGGIPRIANTLCDAALGIAAAESRPSLTPELIGRVAVELLGLGEHAAPPSAQTAPAGTP